MNLIQTVQKFLLGSGQSFSTWTSFGQDTSDQKLIAEYRNLVWKCTDLISNEVGAYVPRLFTKDDKPVYSHPFLRLMDYPNKNVSRFDVMKATQVYLELTGDAYWFFLDIGEKTRFPKSIRVVRPDVVSIVINDKIGEVKGYTVTTQDGTRIPFETSEVVHFKKFNPENEYKGLGTVEAGILYIETEKYTSEFQRNFLKNQATPSGVLTINGKIDTDTFAKIKRRWQEATAGLSNAGKTLFIRNVDAKFEKLGLSLSDLNMEVIKKISKDDVLSMFGVPEAILGKSDQNGLGRNNIEALEYIFGKYTIDPRMDFIDSVLKLKIKEIYGDEFDVRHDFTVIGDKEHELNEDNLAVDRWLTRNEIRVKRGYEPIDGGGRLYLSMTQSDMNEAPIESAKSIVKTVEKCEHDHKSVVEEKKEVIEKAKEDLRMFNALEILNNRYNKRYRKGFLQMTKNQEAEVLKYLGEEKKEVTTTDLINYTLVFSRDELELNLMPVLMDAIQKAGELGIDLYGEPDQEFLLLQSKRDQIFNSTDRLMQTFNKQTSQKVQKQIMAGYQEGETVEQIRKRVKGVFKEIEASRSTRLADSEVHQILNEGLSTAFQQVGFRKMVWRINPGACEFCQIMNGSVTTIGQPYIVEGDSLTVGDQQLIFDYGDIKYANLHPNCRCYLEPVRESKSIGIVDVEKKYKEKMNELDEKFKKAEEVVEKQINEKADLIIKKLEQSLND